MLSHLTKVNDTYVPPGSWWNIVPRGKAGQRRSNRVFLARREEELSKRAIVSFLFSLARVGEPHTYIYSYPRFEAEDGDGRVGRIRRIWPRPLIERGYRYQPLSAYPLGQRPSPQRRPGYLAQRIVSHLFPSPYASSYLSLSLENVSGSTNAFRYQRFERSVFSFCSPLGRR